MFEYIIKFRSTLNHANVDALSCLSLEDTLSKSDVPPELILLVDHLEYSPITAEQIKHATRRDPELSAVLQFVQQGWPHKSGQSNIT